MIFVVQTKNQSRNLINNSRICEDVVDGIKNVLACTSTSDRCNATFGADDLNHGMLKGAVMDSSVRRCAYCSKLETLAPSVQFGTGY